ncbi:hypothetical protein NQ315_003040 [Exocentrus adspersus]|uniref:Aminopeptidase n=1 Tax=Exocentrus adspersus TaxID=1586481 RepID=A0AAV8W4A1_9CUCU|nr:hypothetical protein NQ315_003040 [Exocentrus adspersus]
MVSYYNQGVPTTVDLENNSNQKKYTINRTSHRGLVISRPLCALMAIGALLLALLVGLLVFFLLPRYCTSEETPEALVKSETSDARVFAADAVVEDVDERLPRSLEPTHYRIQIVPNFDNLTTSGALTILLKPKEDVNKIILNVNNITIDKHSVVVKSTKSGSVPIAINDQDYIAGQRYRIVLDENLKSGGEYELALKYNGELNRHLQGFYLSRFNDRLGNERYAAATQFSPTDARRAFPCFDEPSFKSKFTISLARPSNMTSLSNMPISSTDLSVDQNNSYHWDHYPETPKMSTYLVAFIISNLKSLSSNNSHIKVWAREEFLGHTRYASEIAPKILHYFENYFGLTFPLPKMDIVAVPEFGFSAMENWGLITFRESSLLFDPDSSTTEDQRTIATVLSHEIAHQWFGNLVTPKWWNDLWLKEGFATYLQYFGVDFAQPDWKITEEFIAIEMQKAMGIDSLESTRPISFEVKSSRQIRQAFDEISYSKGAAIIRMMNHFLGDEVFKNGLINFLRIHANDNADRQDLFASLTEEAHRAGVLLQNETVKDIMDTWTEKAGFPIITCIADYEKNRLHITQKRFYLNDKDERSSWWVPLSFTTSRAPNFEDTRPKFWLRGEYEIMEDVGYLNEWYLLNLNQTGYYIVNYDEKNWKALIQNIMDLPTLTRAQLISDSMELARANMLDYDIPLRMIARMAVQDTNIMFVPTWVAFKKLKFLSDILSATPAFGHFEEYHRAIFKATYSVVTFDDKVDQYITRRIRQTVLEWSCMSPDSACVHQSRSKFRQLMINDHSVEPNLRAIVYCTAVREGTEIEWDFAYRRYLETQSPSEKNLLLDALGCTKLEWLLSRYIDKLTDDPSIRIQDADRVFESVAKNRAGTQIAFDFLRKNWNKLLDHYGEGFNILAKMIKALAPHMNTEFQLSEFERFRSSIRSNISTTTIAFNSAIERVKSNVEWMNKNYNQVADWLIKYKEHFAYL